MRHVVWQYLLRLFPFEYRELFGSEIAGVFEERLVDSRKRGKLSVAGFALHETATLLVSAWREWLIKRQQRGAYLSALLLRSGSLPVSPSEERERLRLLVRQMEYAIAHHDFERARQFAFAEQRLRIQLSGSGNG